MEPSQARHGRWPACTRVAAAAAADDLAPPPLPSSAAPERQASWDYSALLSPKRASGIAFDGAALLAARVLSPCRPLASSSAAC